jgi:superfamily II DNA helicase RecQ
VDLTGYRFLSGGQADRLKMGSAVAAYASTTACRQQHLLQYFGEQVSSPLPPHRLTDRSAA